MTPAAEAGVVIKSLDTSATPSVRLTVVTSNPSRTSPRVLDDGSPAADLTAVNLARDKKIVLAVDHSQSMHGQALRDAARAAQRFITLSRSGDQFAVVTFGSRASVDAGFGSSASAGAALDGLQVDRAYGTTLYDAVVRGSKLLASTGAGGRVIVLVTDGQETTSHASLEQAVRAARRAHVSVFPVAIETLTLVHGHATESLPSEQPGPFLWTGISPNNPPIDRDQPLEAASESSFSKFFPGRSFLG